MKEYPSAAEVWKNLGKTCLLAGNEEAARTSLEKAIRLNPNDEDSILNLGVLSLKNGKVKDAEVLLNAAAALNEEDPVAQKNLGVLYADYLRKPDRAVAHFKRYLELSPDSPDAPSVRKYIAGAGSVKK